MKNSTEQFLQKYNLLHSPMLLAFSGGFDSCALADILFELSQKHGFYLALAHLNHNWRGKESKKEQEKCRLFAQERNLPFFTAQLDDTVAKTETAAREARYEFLTNCAKENNIPNIFTAHTSSDNSETLLYRVIKGTGIDGLQGIAPHIRLNEVNVYRPLLDFDRNDILKYCQNNNLSPNNDSSNSDTKYMRNKIRAEILPLLKEINPEVETALTRLIHLSKENEEIICNLLEETYRKIKKDGLIYTSEFIKLSKSLQKRIIKDFLEKENIDYDFKKVTEVFDFIQAQQNSKSGKTLSITNNLWLFVQDKKMEFIAQTNTISTEKELDLNGETHFEELGIKLICTPSPPTPEQYPDSDASIAYVDLSSIKKPVIVRTRRKGDIITPFSHSTPIKLKKFLNNYKIPKHQKESLALLAEGNEILWVINFGLNAKIKVDKTPTHKIETISL
ncbi:MAG: tRNA lysidine(34) synthetase TilS [Candidatus Gastranaerophilales bacterium]|nr:tRNA lysidine(34) synthetase TilS [Candidatus Gastranaerophilales bacterium]